MEPKPVYEKDSEVTKTGEAVIAAEAIVRMPVPSVQKPAPTPRQSYLNLDHTEYDLPYSQPRGPVI